LVLWALRAEDPEYVIENGLKIDTEYYLNKQMLPPLLRMFESFGINELDLLQPGRQQNLFSIGKIEIGEKETST